VKPKPVWITAWCTGLLLVLTGLTIAENQKPARSEKNQITLSTQEIMEEIAGKAEPYPTYTTQLINLANQNAQATRPQAVGQMSELIQKCPGKTYEEWVSWFLKEYPSAIDQATDKTYDMILKMQGAMAGIDRDMVRTWIAELILTKTYAGLRFQESILKKIAKIKNTSYRLATADEESRGIDGYIGKTPVSIKPTSYRSKDFLHDTIEAEVIFYEKVRGGITVFYDWD
jgi:hypothetical protein